MPGRPPVLTDVIIERVHELTCPYKQVGLIHKWKNKVACPTWQINGKMLNVRWVQWEETPEAPWETPKCYG